MEGRKRGRGSYVSEFTAFLERYIEEHPDIREDQQRGWYIYWDRQPDTEQGKLAGKDTVPAKPYYYD